MVETLLVETMYEFILTQSLITQNKPILLNLILVFMMVKIIPIQAVWLQALTLLTLVFKSILLLVLKRMVEYYHVLSHLLILDMKNYDRLYSKLKSRVFISEYWQWGGLIVVFLIVLDFYKKILYNIYVIKIRNNI